jgi:hypothetical protein
MCLNVPSKLAITAAANQARDANGNRTAREAETGLWSDERSHSPFVTPDKTNLVNTANEGEHLSVLKEG